MSLRTLTELEEQVSHERREMARLEAELAHIQRLSEQNILMLAELETLVHQMGELQEQAALQISDEAIEVKIKVLQRDLDLIPATL